MNAAVLRGQKIPRLQLDQLTHQLHQIARHNEKARSLMVRRAQQQRAHVNQIVEAMKGEDAGVKWTFERDFEEGL